MILVMNIKVLIFLIILFILYYHIVYKENYILHLLLNIALKKSGKCIHFQNRCS